MKAKMEMVNKQNDDAFFFGAVIGDPIGHSLSPHIFDYINRHLRPFPAFSYVPIRVTPEELRTAINLFRQLPFTGLNVTLPHKQTIISCLDQLAPSAAKVAAVNVVQFMNDSGSQRPTLIGHNTDIIGLKKTLQENAVALKGKKAALLGAGGAALACGVVLGELGLVALDIIVRDSSKAHPLMMKLRELHPGLDVNVQQVVENKVTIGKECALLIHTTPMGMKDGPKWEWELEWTSSAAPLWALDLIYRPLKTPFLEQAEQRGMKTLNGLDWLIWQALATMEILLPWSGGEDKKQNNQQREFKSNLRSHLLKILASDSLVPKFPLDMHIEPS